MGNVFRLETRLTELLDINIPIIQGGLAYLANADLAAAVSNAGALGQLTAMTCESPEVLLHEIQNLKTLTRATFGVNFAIGQHGRPYEDYLEVAIKEKVPVITVTGGNPTPVIKALKESHSEAKILILVSSVRQALKAEALGADAVMAVGFEGGGHLGREETTSLVLIPAIVDAVNIPVVASGGFSDGRSLMAALALGAEGIEMGTRFIATKECTLAHEVYKQKLLEAHATDTTIIKRTLGAPARALKNQWIDEILEMESQGGTYEELKHHISGKANRRMIYEGDDASGFGWAGQVVEHLHDIPTVAALMERIQREATCISKKWGTFSKHKL
ncbi:enoyl-[acyl-carrier protein] reductase II [Pullulanibacillus pueri]|uniref:Probable nitronate monooxygenase n=1 Tax=Pullulanibacillus pueri TaxID=1437324 RepID=A0A8J2ZRU6_9BACL|nr:nitronate monooxygenase [Pullulanibacillus pueri]MBM7680082.1 enoyl-[acyl-carrier protein] reductase II [Pullulanibacillus pueri]GGH74281.1 nitronate monooxygenase [Pullulanibacillus pueri]